MDTYCLNTHDTPQARFEQHVVESPKQGAQVHTPHRFSLGSVCVYVNVFVCERRKRRLRFGVVISETVLFI